MPSVLNAENELVQAFRVLLQECLQLREGDDLLVIYDESLFEHFDDLVAANYRSPWEVTYVHLPLAYQRELTARAKLGREGHAIRFSAALDSAMLAATAILNVLDADLDTGPVRRALVHQPRTGTCRLAHTPGLDANVLRLLGKSPIRDIEKSAEALAWALGEAQNGTLITSDSNGKSYSLSMALDGWDNEPFISSGVIAPGSWGNVPPGETFCCPPHERVNGSICINGSIPGYRLEPGQEVVLRFERGVLADFTGAHDSPASRFLVEQRKKARERGDENWNTFAELGIGLNPAIDKLTGNALFDEKAARTAHIAIGDNDCFGHHVASGIHADLVTHEASLQLDGLEVLSKGELNLDKIEKLRGTRVIDETEFTSDTVMYLREDSVHVERGRLRRRLHRAHRVGYVDMVAPPVAGALGELARELKTFEQVEVHRFLDECASFRGYDTRELLGILHHYRVIGVLDSPVGAEE